MKQIPNWCCNCKFWWHDDIRDLLGHCAYREANDRPVMRLWANDVCPQFVWATKPDEWMREVLKDVDNK